MVNTRHYGLVPREVQSWKSLLTSMVQSTQPPLQYYTQYAVYKRWIWSPHNCLHDMNSIEWTYVLQVCLWHWLNMHLRLADVPLALVKHELTSCRCASSIGWTSKQASTLGANQKDALIVGVKTDAWHAHFLVMAFSLSSQLPWQALDEQHEPSITQQEQFKNMSNLDDV